ncbi:hypothetical protein LCGC14_2759680 [marine sediment metagenome]|uniref:Uncharacterized protein n=1 Tax=marine sediment metagenome TaxID=412755 RepID=A0A0F9B7V3_9ZZZZ
MVLQLGTLLAVQELFEEALAGRDVLGIDCPGCDLGGERCPGPGPRDRGVLPDRVRDQKVIRHGQDRTNPQRGASKMLSVLDT